jgi:hypothetical protein
MTDKHYYTRSFVSENVNKDNMHEKGVDVYGQLDSEIREQLDYNAFRTAWAQYSRRLIEQLASTIIVIADERFGDTWVLTPDELPSHLVHCSIAFDYWDEEEERKFMAAIEEYDLSDKDELDDFDFHKDYILRTECWTASAATIIKRFVS